LNSQSANSKLAMVVDDDPIICEYVKMHLEQNGYSVRTLTDPTDFPVVYSADVDLVFLDLNMPNIDGVELIRFLADKGSRAFIALLSGYDKAVLRAVRDLAVDKGLNVLGTLQKPFRDTDVVGLIEQYQDHLNADDKESSKRGAFFRAGSEGMPSIEELRDAIASRALDVFFQPKVGLIDRNSVGVEALVRWNHPEKGFIPPDYFVPYAEQYDLINELTEVVVEKVGAHLSDELRQRQNLTVSINISEKNLDNLGFPEMLEEQIKKSGLVPGQTILEITETTLSSNPVHVLDVVARLRIKGFMLSIDDFGTGHSSLARLRKFPLSELKIDKVFVDNLATDPETKIIVRNTIDLGHGLGLKIVAEGIEEQSQMSELIELGCDIGQGYLFEKPMPIDELKAWLKDND